MDSHNYAITNLIINLEDNMIGFTFHHDPSVRADRHTNEAESRIVYYLNGALERSGTRCPIEPSTTVSSKLNSLTH